MTQSFPSDEQLLQQIQAGDRSGLNQFHDRYRDLVFTVALRVCGQECDAEAVLVTVFWEIWKNPSQWNPERGSARTYLLLLTRSRARDLMRSEASRTTAHRKASEEIAFQQERHTTDLEPPEWLADSDRSKQLRELAATLPPEMREALDLAFFGGLTHVEIATRLQLPLGTIKTRIRRGLAQLKVRLASMKDDWLIQ